jgi:protein-tyrosine phosphatase
MVIDLHSHVLPSLDDGPSDMAGALALGRVAQAAGTVVIAATPHIGLRYSVTTDELPARVAALQDALAVAQIPLDVIVGGELAPSHAADISDHELRSIALGGSSCVLLESPFTRVGGLMSALVAQLQERGFRVLLGHPERSPEFLRDSRTLVELVGAGAFVQITAASLRGDFGRPIRRYAHSLLQSGLVHVVASDAHDALGRSPAVLPLVREAVAHWEQAETITRFVTEEAPQALLDDAPVPSPPVGATRRRLLHVLRR